MYSKEFIESILNYSQTNKVSEKESAIHFGIEPKDLDIIKRNMDLK